MNITYILGNGFDIQLGLKSRYCDFLEEYIKPKDGDSENVKAFREYLKERANYERWSDAEKAMGEDLGRFSDETVGVYRDQLINFEDELADYLDKQESACNWDRSEEIRDRFVEFIRMSIVKVAKDIYEQPDVSNRNFNFISLNYTALIDKVFHCCLLNGGFVIYQDIRRDSTNQDVLGKIYHVHGDLVDGIIMGVNDESQLTISPELTIDDEIRWQFQKDELSKRSSKERTEAAKELIEYSDVIVLYGVSYGETDARWWNEITKWLKHDEDHRVLAFIYDEDTKLNSRNLYRKTSYENKKKEEILKKFGVLRESVHFDILKEQLYIADATKDLNLRELIHPEEAIAAMKETDKSEV